MAHPRLTAAAGEPDSTGCKMRGKQSSARGERHSTSSPKRKRAGARKAGSADTTEQTPGSKSTGATLAGEAFMELVGRNPELLHQWNERKAEGMYAAKGLWFGLRQMLQRQAQRWRDETGTEP